MRTFTRGRCRVEACERRKCRKLRNAEAAYAVRVAQVREAETLIERSRSELLTHTAVSERLRE